MSISNWFVGTLLAPKRVTAKQIHEEIYLLGDELVNRLNTQILEYFEKESDLFNTNRIKILMDLGFSNHPEVLNSQEEEKKLNQERWLIQKKKNTLVLIEEFNLLYPTCKIVHFSDLQSICKKYGLQQAPVEYYQGTLPDKNLKEIHAFFDRKHTKFSHTAFETTSGREINKIEIPFEQWENKKKYANAVMNDPQQHIRICDLSIKEYFLGTYVEYNLERKNLEICCLQKDLINSWQQMEKLKELIKEDPIVFVKYKEFAIIISAWGAEAEDVAQL